MDPHFLNRYTTFFGKRSIAGSVVVAIISFVVVAVVFFFLTHPSIACDLRGGKWYYQSRACDFKDGKWDCRDVDLGNWMDPPGACKYFYADGGKPCKNDSDCQGGCSARGCVRNSFEGKYIDFAPGEWELAP